MSKYNELKYLKKTKSRFNHQCSRCKEIIIAGDYYYKESLKDARLQLPNAESFCAKCYEQFKESLLRTKGKRRRIENEKSKKLSDFV